MYHDRQRRQFCALHVLNNLFQEEAFTKQQLDDICYSLSPTSTINPHKNVFGLGNYDVNVLTSALDLRGYQLLWFDKRKELSILDLTSIFGFVINRMFKPKFLGLKVPVQRRHWIAVRKVGDMYYDLDSKLNEPKCIGDHENLLSFLKCEILNTTTEMFVVVSNQVAKDETWMRNDNNGEM